MDGLLCDRSPTRHEAAGAVGIPVAYPRRERGRDIDPLLVTVRMPRTRFEFRHAAPPSARECAYAHSNGRLRTYVLEGVRHYE